MLIAGGGIVCFRTQTRDLARELRDLCRSVQGDDPNTLHVRAWYGRIRFWLLRLRDVRVK